MKSSIDIITFSEQLQSRVKERLDELNTDQDELMNIGSFLSFIRSVIEELKAFASTYKFSGEAEEIKFFKEIKPVLLSQYFYYKKIFAIRLFDSFRDAKSRQSNYYQLFEGLERFVKRNQEFYEYCMTNATFLDKHYFTRNNQIKKSVNLDAHFTTEYDTKLAKILTNEMLKKYILLALQRSLTENTGGFMLAWTGPKASLIELIYALHSAEVFNKGAVDIKQIASAFETLFNINLGNYYRTLQEIRLRKSGQTNFLDHLKDKLLRRLSDYD